MIDKNGMFHNLHNAEDISESYAQVDQAVTGCPVQIDWEAQPPRTGYDLLGPEGGTIHCNWHASPPVQPVREVSNYYG